MKLQKLILCAAIALTAFGASLGLLEIGRYAVTAFEPLKVEVKPLEPMQKPFVYPPRIRDAAPPVLTTTAENEPEPEEEPEDWGETGDYYIVDEKPKGFKDFETLSIVDREYNEKLAKVVSVKPNGSVVTENKEFKFSWININGKRISLVTQTKKGVSYQFDGNFVDEEIKLENDDGEEYTETVYLKGRLTKWRDGKKIAEAKVRMSISHGC
jgi:hypothetical protein